MTTKLNYSSLKKNNPTIGHIFTSTFDNVVNEALRLQVMRDSNSSRVYFLPVVESFYPFVTDKSHQAIISKNYSDHFKNKKKNYVDKWKSILPNVFADVEVPVETKSMPTSIVQMDLEKIIEEKEEYTTKCYDFSVSPMSPGFVSCNFNNIPVSIVGKLVDFVNNEIFSFPQNTEQL